jgi:hypothetical protein
VKILFSIIYEKEFRKGLYCLYIIVLCEHAEKVSDIHAEKVSDINHALCRASLRER